MTREYSDPTMWPPPSWWNADQWRAARQLVERCTCDPYDCGPYGHDESCLAAVLSQGQYNAVYDDLRLQARRPTGLPAAAAMKGNPFRELVVALAKSLHLDRVMARLNAGLESRAKGRSGDSSP